MREGKAGGEYGESEEGTGAGSWPPGKVGRARLDWAGRGDLERAPAQKRRCGRGLAPTLWDAGPGRDPHPAGRGGQGAGSGRGGPRAHFLGEGLGQCSHSPTQSVCSRQPRGRLALPQPCPARRYEPARDARPGFPSAAARFEVSSPPNPAPNPLSLPQPPPPAPDPGTAEMTRGALGAGGAGALSPGGCLPDRTDPGRQAGRGLLRDLGGGGGQV